MSPIVLRLAALLLSLNGPSDLPVDLPAVAEVTVDSLVVFDEPDETAFSPGNLRKGDRIIVRESDEQGWLTIDAPRIAFHWIDPRALDLPDPGGRARVQAPVAVLRSGRRGARLPGPPQGELPRGAIVRVLEEPPLGIGQGASRRTWVAIAPRAGDARYVRAEGVRWVLPKRDLAPVQETRVAYQPSAAREDLPAPVLAEIAQIEAIHREVLRGPVEEWRLESIRQRYDALLQRVSDTTAVQAVHARLVVVARHEEMAEASRTFQTILERSRRRDRQIAMVERRLAAVQQPEVRPFEAEGMIQPSSRRVQGQKVFALIGPEGTPLAYLDMPPGLDARSMVARRVGVRGAVHYDEGLRSKLISVRDLEPLDDDR